jgi:hypothetical protein
MIGGSSRSDGDSDLEQGGKRGHYRGLRARIANYLQAQMGSSDKKYNKIVATDAAPPETAPEP